MTVEVRLGIVYYICTPSSLRWSGENASREARSTDDDKGTRNWDKMEVSRRWRDGRVRRGVLRARSFTVRRLCTVTAPPPGAALHDEAAPSCHRVPLSSSSDYFVSTLPDYARRVTRLGIDFGADLKRAIAGSGWTGRKNEGATRLWTSGALTLVRTGWTPGGVRLGAPAKKERMREGGVLCRVCM